MLDNKLGVEEDKINEFNVHSLDTLLEQTKSGELTSSPTVQDKI